MTDADAGPAGLPPWPDILATALVGTERRQLDAPQPGGCPVPPGDPATSLPGDPATSLPGDPAAALPGDPATALLDLAAAVGSFRRAAVRPATVPPPAPDPVPQTQPLVPAVAAARAAARRTTR